MQITYGFFKKNCWVASEPAGAIMQVKTQRVLGYKIGDATNDFSCERPPRGFAAPYVSAANH